MRNIVTVTILLSFYLNAYPQDNSDSLRKYTYFIMGFKIDRSTDSILGMVEGSAFFLKKSEKMFFVTAKHVLHGFNNYCQKLPNSPDTLTILMHDKNGKAIFSNPLLIDIRKIKDTSTCEPCTTMPDYILYEVKDYKKYNIFSIENFKPFCLPKNTGDLVIYGFPSTNTHDTTTGKMIIRGASKLMTTRYSIGSEMDFVDKDGTLKTSSINYVVNTKDFIVGPNLKGFSGSPAFIMDKNSLSYKFIGIFAATEKIENSLVIVKSYFIEK